MTKRKTDEQFQQEIYDLVGDEYTFLDPYVNTHTQLSNLILVNLRFLSLLREGLNCLNSVVLEPVKLLN